MRWLGIVFLLLVVCNVEAATWEVDIDGGTAYTAIQPAIDAAQEGDVILVHPGCYYENLNFNGKRLTLASLYYTTANPAYIDSTIIDGGGQGPCLVWENVQNARLQGLTLQHGVGVYQALAFQIGAGGVNMLYSSGHISHCHIEGNCGVSGGGIWVFNSQLTLKGNRICNNIAKGGGGGIFVYVGQCMFNSQERCSVYDNFAVNGQDIMIWNSLYDSLTIPIYLDTCTINPPSSHFVQYTDYAGNSFPFQCHVNQGYLEEEMHDFFVTPQGDDSNDGASAATPVKTIARAAQRIAADSLHPRTIYLAAGEYLSEDQIYPICLKSYVSLIGEDCETTILDRQQQAGLLAVPSRNEFTTEECCIANLTVKNICLPADYGVGFAVFKCDKIIVKNIKIENSFSRDNSVGNLLMLGNREVQIDNLLFQHNKNAELSHILVSDNWRQEYPDGYNWGYRISNSVFRNNSGWGDNFSTRILNFMNSDAEVENCIFQHNRGLTHNILMLYDHLCNPPTPPANFKVNNCLFSHNKIVDNDDPNSPWTIYHTMIRVTGDDEGLFTMNNCTFANNVAEAAVVSFANTQLRNTIFADSVSRYEIWMPVEDSYHNVYELDVDYCNIRGGMNSVMVEYPNILVWGEHNIDADPLFVGGDSMDPNSFRLSASSPCINAGSPDTTGLPTLDLAGNLRVWDGRVDMGCYEYGSLQAAPTEQTAPEYAMMFSNSPNPFNAETEITFYLDHDQPERITLDIYNIKGQRVKTLFNGKLGIGFHKILWEGDNDGGSEVSSGVYLCRLHTEKVTLFHKMTLLK